MSEMPAPPAAAAPAPAPKRRSPVLIIVIVAVVALICACVACALIFGAPASATFGLMSVCQERNPDLSADACGQWMQAANADMSVCISEIMGSNSGRIDADGLYDCIVARGTVPQ